MDYSRCDPLAKPNSERHGRDECCGPWPSAGLQICGLRRPALGDAVRPVLERQIMAEAPVQGGRFCGIRMPLAWDADPSATRAYPSTRDMIDSSAFREGFTHLAKL